MKVLLYGKNSHDLEGQVNKFGFEIVTQDPDVIISYGGDGTLLFSEREYPGTPKLPIRNSQFCIKCTNHQDEKIFKELAEGRLRLKEYKKLHTSFEGKDLYSLNDFVVRNELPTHAIRFKIQLHEKLHIGDGIVTSTSFGSTGYFKSVTQTSFDEGFGVAFSNAIEKTSPLILSDQETLEFELVRGKAVFTTDNDPNIFHLSEGTKLTFDLSNQVAKIYESNSLRCPDCQVKKD